MRSTAHLTSRVLSATILVGCTAPGLLSRVGAAGAAGPVGFHHRVGKGTLTVRLIDRRFSTQAYTDAEPFSAVRFELTNASKLHASLVKGGLASGGTYDAVFTELPPGPF